MTDRTLAELQARRAICQMCIKTIDQLPKETDGKADAMVEYKRQLASIDKQLEEITGKFPAVVVGLKTAKLFGKTKIGE